MQACLIGVGGAGGRLVDAVAAAAAEVDRSVVTGVYAFDTDRDALDRLRHVPEPKRRHLPLVGDGPSTGSTRGRRRVASDALDERLHELVFDFDDDEVYGADVLVFAAGLGGGVGAGCTTTLANRLSTPYPTPTLTVGVLPDRDGPPRAVVNAAASIDGVWKATDRLLLVDDERCGDPESTTPSDEDRGGRPSDVDHGSRDESVARTDDVQQREDGPSTGDSGHEGGSGDTATTATGDGRGNEDTQVGRASVIWTGHDEVNREVAARLVALFAALPAEAEEYDGHDFLLDTAGQLATLGRGSATPTETTEQRGGLFSRLRGGGGSTDGDTSSLQTALAAAGPETLTLPTDPSTVTTAVAAIRGVDDSTRTAAATYLAEATTAINVGIGGSAEGASVDAVVWYSGLRDRSRVADGTVTARRLLREARGEEEDDEGDSDVVDENGSEAN